MKDVNDFAVIIQCQLKSCDKKVIPRRLLPGQSFIINGDIITAFCSEEHWQSYLKEVMPHH